MKKRLILAAAAALVLSSAGVAQARDLNWSVAIGDPFIGAVISNGHGYGYAAPVYVAPPVVYAPPPRVLYQQPYVYAPYAYAPYRYVQPGRDRWDRRHEERIRYDRYDRYDHWRDGRGDGDRDRHDRNDRDGRDDHRWQRR